MEEIMWKTFFTVFYPFVWLGIILDGAKKYVFSKMDKFIKSLEQNNIQIFSKVSFWLLRKKDWK